MKTSTLANHLLAILLLSPSLALAQDYEATLTEHGHPDLQGVWNFSTRVPLERPTRYGNVEFLSDVEASPNTQSRTSSNTSSAPRRRSSTSIIGGYNGFWNDREALQQSTRTSQIIYPLDGRIPAVNPGVQVQIGGDQTSDNYIPGTRPVRYTHGGISRDGPEYRGLSERCIVFNTGPPLLSGPYNNHIQIVQNADHVVVLVEMGFDARIVSIDNRPHIDGAIQQWSGDSRGYFEGSGLVIETRNFTNLVGSISLRGVAYGNAEDRLLIERFTPTGPNTLDYQFTIDDATTFSDKIIGITSMTRVDDRIYEYACHPGNYALKGILRAGRVEEAAAVNQ
ncbi:MAG: hypothetical protein COC19_06775 [SAR86 cluster bacterium]|uniref:Uncharacterized protein n=1 Tax=SAR86 cluster bacterium TaxID=2030880 RepID=A0A2A4MHW6_9GAMM|nr:MAG: hypothetical protein COC19_06775 [SAR86 cluster bacterium]